MYALHYHLVHDHNFLGFDFIILPVTNNISLSLSNKKLIEATVSSQLILQNQSQDRLFMKTILALYSAMELCFQLCLYK